MWSKIIALIALVGYVYCEDLRSDISCKWFDDKNEPNYRSCVLTNVCYLNKKWTFFDENPNRKFDLLPVRVGTYDTSPEFKIDQVPPFQIHSYPRSNQI